MGRRHYDDTDGSDIRGFMTRLQFVDGDYDRGGAYWGSPANVYWLRDREGLFQAFCRASSRDEAAQIFHDDFPHVKIWGYDNKITEKANADR